MTILLSVITSVKDYIEIAHKLIEVDSSPGSQSVWLIQNYTEFGAFLTYFLITLKQFFIQLFSFQWLKNIWSLPVIVPEIASAMVSEISVLDGFFHNAFTFLDTPLSYGQFGGANEAKNFNIYAFEKFFIGFVNSFFLFLPTSTAHIITIRRFVMQGLEAGYVSALGTIAGNFLWLCSIIFGWRFFVIPWLSFDIFRYVLGFILLVKYMWDCSKERRMVLKDLSKVKIFLLNFLLALTEQTSIYPFISNLSISPDGSMLETSPLPMIGMESASDSLEHLIFIHACYLLGILIGSLSVLKFTCWFWENPAFNLYLWVISTYLKNTKMTTSYFYKYINFTFLYLTMVCAVSSIGYFGLDYTLTNPLGFIAQDRLLEQKEFEDPTKATQGKFFPELAHLSVNPTDKNSRLRSGVIGRMERWKESLRTYQMVDSSLYDQSMYSFLTVEDLNYGFDRFWLRRKMRNHKMRLRIFPGPFMRGLKKQLNPGKRVFNEGRSDKETTPDPYGGNLESSGNNKKDVEHKQESPKESEAKGVEFFRLLFEQYYHPNFHKISNASKPIFSISPPTLPTFGRVGTATAEGNQPNLDSPRDGVGLAQLASQRTAKDEFSALRKFTRNFNTRIKSSTVSLPLLGIKPKVSQENLSSIGGIPGNHNTQVMKPLWSSTWGRQEKVGLLQPFTGNKSKYRSKGAEAPIYSKKWKALFSKLFRLQSSPFYDSDRTRKGKNRNNSRSSTSLFRTMSRNMLSKQQQSYEAHGLLLGTTNLLPPSKDKANNGLWENTKKTMSRQKLSKKDRQILRYQTLLKNNQLTVGSPNTTFNSAQPKMLHTLKFYLQKEESFKRKLKFYGASVFRKLSVGNNAPFFKTMMKRFFYYYKPTLRYKRTLQAASGKSSYRPGSPKKSRLARKLTNISSTSTLAGSRTSGSQTSGSQTSFGFAFGAEAGKQGMQDPQRKLGSVSSAARNQDRGNSITKPTHSYSVLGKKASRYRSQIYRDVLQHWYYTPFNRLLLKLDIDAFMSRQPRAHFLTQNEEHLLHKRRFLLAEHFDTVRWYTYMQHYTAMKNKIGGTKSFSSGVYNQQFQGTFKKIRHLFAITPSQVFAEQQELNGTSFPGRTLEKPGSRMPSAYGSGGFILKFDQPLYNEYQNTKQSSMVHSSVNHEELENMLLAYAPTLPKKAEQIGLDPLEKGVKQPLLVGTTPIGVLDTQASNSNFPNSRPDVLSSASAAAAATQQNDLISESSSILGNYLFRAAPIRQQFIAKLLKEKEYWKLTQFMFQNEQLLDPQILHLAASSTFTESLSFSFTHPNTSNQATQPVVWKNKHVKDKQDNKLQSSKKSPNINIQQDLWVKLLRQNKRHINDREYIANYVTHRMIVSKQRNEQKQADIQLRLARLQLWLNNLPTTQANHLSSSTGLQKSAKEAGQIYSNNYADTPNANATESLLISKGFFYTNDLENTLPTNNIQKHLQKFQMLMGKVKKLIAFLTSPIRALDKQKRTLAWWRKKQQAKYIRKTNVRAYRTAAGDIEHKNPRLEKMKEERKTEINKELRDHYLRFSLPALRKQYKKKPNPSLKDAIDRKEENQRIREKKDYSYFNYSQSPSKLTKIEQSLAADADADANAGNIKTSFVGQMRSSINHLFSSFFKVNYNKGYVARYKSFFPLYPKATKIDYLGTLPLRTDKKGRQILLQYVSKLPLVATSTKKEQQKAGVVQRREKTSPVLNSTFYGKRNLPGSSGITGMGKLRMLIKKIQRIKSNLTIQIWWWQYFLPTYQAEVTLQQQQSQTQPMVTKYKPLSTLLLATNIPQPESSNIVTSYKSSNTKQETEVKQKAGVFATIFSKAENVLTKVYATLFAPSSGSLEKNLNTSTPGKQEQEQELLQQADLLVEHKSMLPYIKPVNPVPFYAGWDEGLRKLVITNRFLSRRQAGQLLQPVLLPNGNQARQTSTGSLLNGLNEGAYVYNSRDMPFSAYAIEQFDGTRQTFYAPLGWRRFQFRHSILKTWFSLSPSLAMLNSRPLLASPSQVASIEHRAPTSNYFSNLPKGYSSLGVKRVAPKWTAGNIATNLAQKNGHRRTKKRFSLMYSNSNIGGVVTYEPTGTLLTEVLPSHYMSIYDNKYRLPNSRYLSPDLSTGLPFFVDLTSNEKTTLSIPPNSCLPLVGNTLSFPGSSTPAANQSLLPTVSIDAAHATHSAEAIYPLKGKADDEQHNQAQPGKAALQKEKVILKKYKEKIKSAPDDIKCLLKTTIDNNKLDRNGVSLDFTLRKRIKTQRKFHRQRTIANNGLIFPRRRKFVQQINFKSLSSAAVGDSAAVGNSEKALLNTYALAYKEGKTDKEVEGLTLRWRPSAFKKLKNVRQEKTKKRATVSAAKLKQLRPSEKQQVLISPQRFQPRQGGFVWPGQYLLLEFKYLPIDPAALNKGWTRKKYDLSVDLNNRFFGRDRTPSADADADSDSANQRLANDKAYKLQEVKPPLTVELRSSVEGAIPRKYLIQKHNIKVLKKKLQNAHRSNKLQERVKQLRYMLTGGSN